MTDQYLSGKTLFFCSIWNFCLKLSKNSSQLFFSQKFFTIFFWTTTRRTPYYLNSLKQLLNSERLKLDKTILNSFFGTHFVLTARDPRVRNLSKLTDTLFTTFSRTHTYDLALSRVLNRTIGLKTETSIFFMAGKIANRQKLKMAIDSCTQNAISRHDRSFAMAMHRWRYSDCNVITPPKKKAASTKEPHISLLWTDS